MSNIKPSGVEESFTSRLDILSVTTSSYIAMLETHANTPRAILAAIGPAGIGKTAIPVQVCKARSAPCAVMHMTTKQIEDFQIPTTAVDTKQYYDKRIPREFEEIIEYTRRLRAENNGEFPAGRNAMLILDELNRAVDKSVTRAAFTLIEGRMIGDVRLDDAIQIVVTMNPSGGGMSVNDFDKDPAMRRRLVFIGVGCNYADFMKYARDAKLHPEVVDYIEAQPNALYDTDGVAAGKKFACPAAWETASQLAYAYQAQKIPFTAHEARASFAGTIGLTATEAFLAFTQDRTVVISPDEVLRGYLPKSTVRERVKKLMSDTDNRLDMLTTLTTNMTNKIMSERKKIQSYSKQLALFLDDVPEETCVAFIHGLSGYAATNTAMQSYFLEISTAVMNEPAFSKTAERLQRTRGKLDEAEKTVKKR